ncbi:MULTISPECIES: metallopeptidase TldD-related protein [Tissierellales]|jgi:predicted Zn-dependent protease|uniref:TldD/PmbA family protein n=1 Tax=Acidilutibacter cellobiosedens TaxID=2507161 RepID=A0A410QB87_9FIRM|nr:MULTISPECIES: metallopeptidase TldD-related protein [Tissierellales]MBE6081958.1 TldD/PmbA family protein [Tissierellaceae bacterium]QAT61229.1 TldD/PmbA family protein [Acidilutibacter cellobiosedens]SCL93470.1 peptidase PmbA [Sporanaerobacter sp. PP17-6a]
MIDNIKRILEGSKEINEWKIVENKISSKEVFFIKDKIQMNRGKDVLHYKVTLYRDFEEDNKKYRGSSIINIHPTMSMEEIKSCIDDASFSAGFVKNEYYPIPEGNAEKFSKTKSNFCEGNISDWIEKLSYSLYKENIYEKGFINSSELFLDRICTRILNSKGLDVSFSQYKGMVQVVTSWEGDKGEIELYNSIRFADYDDKMIREEIRKQLLLSEDRAKALPTPSLNKENILLTGKSVKEFLGYYYSKSNAKGVYDGISTFKKGSKVQGNEVKGDLINMSLNPFMENSTESTPYDEDGFKLEKIDIIKDGVLLRYWGDVRHSYYLNAEPTGNIGNVFFAGGSKSVDEMKKEPYLELISFSDFQMDGLTGDFGGEIRLGFYFDGENTVPVTGGSISGNIIEVEKNLTLSKEIEKENNFSGPKAIQIHGINVLGIK